jgi:REP element-mobilizing transposase RayT
MASTRSRAGTAGICERPAAWVQDVAEKNAWELEELEIFPDYVLLEVRVPQKMLADEVISRLMAETTRLGAQYFPGVTGGETLWADGYYIVSPARTLTDREVARFITYQRQSQIQ